MSVKKQVLVFATNVPDFEKRVQPFLDKGFLMVPESLRIVSTNSSTIMAVILEQETSE